MTTFGLVLDMIIMLCISDTSSLIGNNRLVRVNLRWNPLIQIGLIGYPACGTTDHSMWERVPAKVMSHEGRRRFRASAIAIAGKTCPPVPPAAIKTLYG